jgi:hypothetical protein
VRGEAVVPRMCRNMTLFSLSFRRGRRLGEFCFARGSKEVMVKAKTETEAR